MFMTEVKAWNFWRKELFLQVWKLDEREQKLPGKQHYGPEGQRSRKWKQTQPHAKADAAG